jgi:hypothetical protein
MKKDNKKNKNETEKMFSIVSLFAFVVTLILSIMNTKFIPSCMLMLSLLLFSICYIIKDNNKKITKYLGIITFFKTIWMLIIINFKD